jgi:hypothetical protein
MFPVFDRNCIKCVWQGQQCCGRIATFRLPIFQARPSWTTDIAELSFFVSRDAAQLPPDLGRKIAIGGAGRVWFHHNFT